MDNIKAKIIELCPDVLEEHSVACDMDTSHGYAVAHANCTSRDLTLAVVLRAIEKTVLNRCIFVSASGRFYEERAGQNVQLMPGKWNLAQDNYDNQPRETQLFIGSLLGVEK